MREGAYELVKKRYNVAASRARDQLWVVHSFDPHRDLKADDLRFQLLQHAQDPERGAPCASARDTSGAESPLEREVVKRLTEAGYRVKLQHERGALPHRHGGRRRRGKRLAVECDGDRYRSLESLAEDTARQAILERLGWQFVRIRGSAFYRDPDAALKRVFDRLAELGIERAKDTEDAESEAASDEKTLIEEIEALRERFVTPITRGSAAAQKPVRKAKRGRGPA